METDMTTALRAGALAALASALFSTASHAGPTDYVFTPVVEEGEREIDFKAGVIALAPSGHEHDRHTGGYGSTQFQTFGNQSPL